MKHLFIGLLLCLFVLGLSGNGIAADVNLTDACNANRKNSVRILDSGVTQRCDGTRWVNASSGGITFGGMYCSVHYSSKKNWGMVTRYRNYIITSGNGVSCYQARYHKGTKCSCKSGYLPVSSGTCSYYSITGTRFFCVKLN